MSHRAYVFAALLAIPSDIDARIGSRITQPGKYRRFTDYTYLPQAYLAYKRPSRDHRHALTIQKRQVG